MILSTRVTARLSVPCLVLLLGSGLGLGQSVVVAFMLDDFTDQQHVDTGGSNPDWSTEIGSMIGGDRILELYTEVSGIPFGATGQSLDAQLIPIPEFSNLQLATSSSFDSISTVTYNGGGLGLGGIDLTKEGGDRFLFDLQDHDHTADWFVTVRDTSNNIATHIVSFGAYAENPPDLSMLFTDFTNYSSTDFANVDEIEFQVVSTQSALDFTLDFFAVGTVPEPSSAVLLFCVGGLVARRRRDQQR